MDLQRVEGLAPPGSRVAILIAPGRARALCYDDQGQPTSNPLTSDSVTGAWTCQVATGLHVYPQAGPVDG